MWDGVSHGRGMWREVTMWGVSAIPVAKNEKMQMKLRLITRAVGRGMGGAIQQRVGEAFRQ